MSSFLLKNRHGTVYYFRRKIPLDLRDRFSVLQVYKSLGTEDRKSAIVCARHLAAQTDQLCRRLRSMPKSKKDESLRLDLIVKFDLNSLLEPKSVEIDFEPSEIAAAERAIAAIKRPGGIAAVQQNSFPTSKGISIKEAIAKHTAGAHISQRTKKRYAPVFREFADYFGKDTQLSQITQSKFAEYTKSLAHSNRADRTISLHITTSNGLLRWCKSICDDVPSIQTDDLPLTVVLPGDCLRLIQQGTFDLIGNFRQSHLVGCGVPSADQRI